MKIYHTETQEDYDALMVELEAEGCKWWWGMGMGITKKPTQWNGWEVTGKETGVKLDGNIMGQDFISWYKSSYEHTPIIKYKAKTEE